MLLTVFLLGLVLAAARHIGQGYEPGHDVPSGEYRKQ